MKKDAVPQDNASTYAGYKRLLYAIDQQGQYGGVQSSGWEVEEFATVTAIEAFDQRCADAHRRASEGKTSPLEYHMYKKRMDLPLLAQTSGLFKWRIKRHFQPSVFKRLPRRILRRYSEALDLSPEALQTLPKEA